MKVKLNVLERITMMGLLPEKENYLTFKMIVDLKKDLSFSEKEFKACGIKNLSEGRVSWDKDIVKEIEITDTIEAMICEKLKSLETEKNINESNISLYELLILNNRERPVKK